MRSHYLQHEEQQLIHKQLGEVKAEANRHVYIRVQCTYDKATYVYVARSGSAIC